MNLKKIKNLLFNDIHMKSYGKLIDPQYLIESIGVDDLNKNADK